MFCDLGVEVEGEGCVVDDFFFFFLGGVRRGWEIRLKKNYL